MKNEITPTTIWMTSYISAMLNEGIDTTGTNHISWFTKKGLIVLKDVDKQIHLVDCSLDTKTYFTLHGLASLNNFTIEQYDTMDEPYNG